MSFYCGIRLTSYGFIACDPGPTTQETLMKSTGAESANPPRRTSASADDHQNDCSPVDTTTDSVKTSRTRVQNDTQHSPRLSLNEGIDV